MFSHIMGSGEMKRIFGAYQLREAAGLYWLIDMSQSGEIWKRPLCLNETGARLITGFCEGRSIKTLAREMLQAYGMPENEQTIKEMCIDVQTFAEDLKKQGIVF